VDKIINGNKQNSHCVEIGEATFPCRRTGVNEPTREKNGLDGIAPLMYVKQLHFMKGKENRRLPNVQKLGNFISK
jgi:hypothetical protein